MRGQPTDEYVSLKHIDFHWGAKVCSADVCLKYKDGEYCIKARGDGQYDAFMKAVYRIYGARGKSLATLTNYAVAIPPGGRTDAFVQTIITWSYKGKSFRTTGLDADQTEAAIKATIKMLNLIAS